jgi:hypothetical protein
MCKELEVANILQNPTQNQGWQAGAGSFMTCEVYKCYHTAPAFYNLLFVTQQYISETHLRSL